jgi:hypothetical protein
MGHHATWDKHPRHALPMASHQCGEFIVSQLGRVNALADVYQSVFRDLPLQGACFGLRQIDGKDQFCGGRREAMACDWHICFFTKKNI